ncbi:MAG: twin-arginine translocation signal domain-containing protein [Candidatus Sumerlaeia bacterium]|nr:twin-arginine translocation signal domain-containing protein [Candidatus Sumerlaeia bacterium]
MTRRNFIKVAGIGTAAAALPACTGVAPFNISKQRKPKPFTIVALPDTQHYARAYPHIFTAQTEWIRDHVKELDIFMVIHEGDITDNNTVAEWENARRSMDVLDGVVPYTLNSGNHDQPGWGNERHLTHFYDYFPESRYKDLPWFGGTWDGGMENAYWKFERDGIPYLVLCLEFGPRDEPIAWANEVVAKHPHHRVIFSTHCYTYSDNTRVGPGDDWNPRTYAGAHNDGEELWEKLVRHHPNIFLVLSGHILHDGKGRLTSLNDHGNPCHQILANYQMLAEGGEGWLRIMKFDPENNLIDVKTYSPRLERFATDEQNQFVLENAFRPGFFA